MGVKDYLKKKKEAYDINCEKREMQREFQSKLDRARALEEAKEARKKYAELRKAEKARKDIAKYKAAAREERYQRSAPAKIARGFDSLGNTFDSIGKARDDIFGKPTKSQNSNPLDTAFGGGGDIVGFNNIFGKPKKAAPKKRKKKKSKGGKSITIKLN